MKKKIWTVLFVLVLCLCVTVAAFAEGAAGFAGDKEDRVVDGADLLSDIEETELREKLEDNPAAPQHILTKWGVGYYLKD